MRGSQVQLVEENICYNYLSRWPGTTPVCRIYSAQK